MLPDGYRLEALRLDHAPALAEAYSHNAEHLRPFEPVRPPEFFTVAGQEAAVAGQVATVDRGVNEMWVLLRGDEVAGRVNLNTIVRGAFHSVSLGYWVGAEHQGRGLATAMVAHACERALRLGLHRVDAGTLVDNAASQRVLEKSGFTRYGLAPSYLFIAGEWRDHVLFQRILHDRPL